MAHPGLSRSRPRNEETQLPQPDRHGSMREAQACLTKKLRERDLGRDLEGAKITLNEYLDRWLGEALSLRLHDFDFPRACSHYSHDPADTLAAHSAAHRKNHSAHKLLTAWRKLSVVDPVDD